MSCGASALFKWNPGPSLDSEASCSWLHHGDFWSWMVVVTMSLSLYGTLVGEGTGEYHISVDQVPRSSVSSGRWGGVLPAHMREGFTRVFHTDSFPQGFSALRCSVGIVGLGAFLLVGLFPPCLELRWQASCCCCLFCWVRPEFLVFCFFWMRGTLVWNRLPSLLNSTRTSYFGTTGHLGRMAGQGIVRPYFTFFFGSKSYLSLQIFVKDTVVSLDWSGEAPWVSIEQSSC